MVWPVHPRSKNKAKEFDLWERLEAIEDLHLAEPVGYLDNVSLMSGARLAERANTERPITITEGTNTLVGTDSEVILQHVKKHLSNGVAGSKELPRPLYWDGKTAERIVDVILSHESWVLSGA